MLTTLTTALAALLAAGSATSSPVQDGAALRAPFRTVFVGAGPRASRIKPFAAPARVTVPRIPQSSPRIERGPCNMPVIVADAAVDRGILFIIPDDARAKMKTAQPEMCKQAP